MLPDPADIGALAEVVRARREELGLSQADLAAAVCLADRPTVTGNDIARWERGKRIPRSGARRALEMVLELPIHLLDRAAAEQRAVRNPEEPAIGIAALVDSANAVGRIRSAFLEANGLAFAADDSEPPDCETIQRDLDRVMLAYQTSRFDEMLDQLPDLIETSHRATYCYRGRQRQFANKALALSSHASAMVLTKVGEHDLAWIASDRGLNAADDAEDEAIVGSLRRSMVHTLQTHGRNDAATRLAERTADDLRSTLPAGDARQASVYGTLLLAASMAAARTGDQSGVDELLDEADHYARQLGRDANHLWTAFGPTNVAVHRVATAVALDDIGAAEHNANAVDASDLPSERRIRYLFDLAMIAVQRNRTDAAIATMLEAERLAPAQVHRHVMAQQIVAHLRNTKVGRQDPRLAQLDQRTRHSLATS